MKTKDLDIKVVNDGVSEFLTGGDLGKFKDRLYWLKRRKNGCLEYLGGKSGDGYGLIRINKKSYRANRIAYMLYKGPIKNGIFICHKCDNPICINENHLFAGTPKENTQDMVKKGRNSAKAGFNNPEAKLNSIQVERIRRKYTKGHKSRPDNHYTIRGLALQYNVSTNTIFRVVHNLSYRDSNEQN